MFDDIYSPHESETNEYDASNRSASSSEFSSSITSSSSSHFTDEKDAAAAVQESNYDARPPTSNTQWHAAEDSCDEPSGFTMDALTGNPLAEPALELYIAKDGVSVEDVPQQLQLLNLRPPPSFSAMEYLSSTSRQGHSTAEASDLQMMVLSPEEWLAVVQHVWLLTHRSNATPSASPQPVPYSSLDLMNSNSVKDVTEGSPDEVDATAKKKKQTSMSLDLSAPPRATSDMFSIQGATTTAHEGETTTATTTVTTTNGIPHSAINVSSNSSAQTADPSGIENTTANHYNSDSTTFLRQLFPTSDVQTSAAGTTTTTTTKTTTHHVPRTDVPARRSSVVVSPEEAARELFVLSGAVPMRTISNDEVEEEESLTHTNTNTASSTRRSSTSTALQLTIGGWEHTLRLHNHGKMPPQPIVEDATRALATLAFVAPSRALNTAAFTSSLGSGASLSALLAATSTSGHRAVLFGPFYTLLTDQLRQVTYDVARGFFTNDRMYQRVYHIPDDPPPTLCLVLAAMAPTEMELLAGAPALAFLRAIGTVESALRALVVALEEEVTHRVRGTPAGALGMNAGTVAERSSRTLVVASGGSVARPPSARTQLAEELNWQQDDAVNTGASPSASTNGLFLPSARRVNSASVVRGTPAGATQPLTGSSTARRSAPPRPDSARIQSRYKESKPLDEISTSVVARAKARRLLDTLRKQTIPINRYEWYVRAEGEAPPLETNFVAGLKQGHSGSDSDDSDAMQNMEEALTLRVGPRPASTSALMTTASSASPNAPRLAAPDRTDTSNLYRLGGVITVSVTPKAHKATFDRLSKPRCDPRLLSGVSSRPLRLTAARRAAALRRRQERDATTTSTAAETETRGSSVYTPLDKALPAPRLYTVPARRPPSTDISASVAHTAGQAAVDDLPDAVPRRAQLAPPRYVAHELSYGSADEDDMSRRRRQHGAPDLSRATSAPRRRRRQRRTASTGAGARGGGASATRPVSSRKSQSQKKRNQSHRRRPSSRGGAVDVTNGSSWTPYHVPTAAAPATAAAPPTMTGTATSRRLTRGSRRSTRKSSRARSRQPAAEVDAVFLPRPRDFSNRPSDDPYPFLHPTVPAHARKYDIPSAAHKVTHKSTGDAQAPHAHHHQHSARAHRHRGGDIGAGCDHPDDTRRSASTENFVQFEQHMIQRFSNSSEPYVGGSSPHLSPDTERSHSSSYRSYSASSDSDGDSDERHGCSKQADRSDENTTHATRRASELARQAQALAHEKESRYSTSFPSLTSVTAADADKVRRTNLPRRVLAPLLVASSSRMPSEVPYGSGSRVEPLDPLMFTASSMGASAGRPPLTPMAPSSATHRRVSR